MVVARYEHDATLLNNGKVLITGGLDPGPTAELYDPETGTFSVTVPVEGDPPVTLVGFSVSEERVRAGGSTVREAVLVAPA